MNEFLRVLSLVWSVIKTHKQSHIIVTGIESDARYVSAKAISYMGRHHDLVHVLKMLHDKFDDENYMEEIAHRANDLINKSNN